MQIKIQIFYIKNECLSHPYYNRFKSHLRLNKAVACLAHGIFFPHAKAGQCH